MREINFEIENIINIGENASDIIMRYYRDIPEKIRKQDGSPVTIADQEVEKYIIQELTKLTPNIPIIGEELVAEGKIPDISGGEYWCVDPIDGTEGFIKQNDMFCICIALIKNKFPIFGLIYSPTENICWFSCDGNAYKYHNNKKIKLQIMPIGEQKTALTSPKITKKMSNFLADYPITDHKYLGSALKFCLLAENKAHFYPRLGPSSQWDIAAGQAILEAAGGKVYDLHGNRFAYDISDFTNQAFIASNDEKLFPAK